MQADALRGYLDGVEFASGAGSQLWTRSGDIGIGRMDDDGKGLEHTTTFHDGDAAVGESNRRSWWWRAA